MKALSIRQPWAWLILHAGKDIENRDWKPNNPGLRFRGEFLIHASSGMTHDEYEDALQVTKLISLKRPFPSGLALPRFEKIERGGIVGRAVITNVVRSHSSPWFFGPYGFVIEKPEPLPFAACKGQLGFFDIPVQAIYPTQLPFETPQCL